MYEDLIEISESCNNCWWSSGRKTDNGVIYCSLHKNNQGLHMWCSSWIDRVKRTKVLEKE